MRAALNKYFLTRYKKEGRSFRETLGRSFLGKIKDILFLRFYACGPFDGGTGIDVSNALVSSFFRLLFVVKYFMLNFILRKFFLAAETCELIHW